MKNLFLNKDSLLNTKRIYAIDPTNGQLIWKSDKVFPQHFYPLSIKDYCYALKNAVCFGLDKLPILSISSKDFPYCDFNCVDCLACISREWAVSDNNIKYPIIPIEIYKNILSEIANFSSKRGCNHVRFEICGEGNPDLYKERQEMLQYAYDTCGMGIVYVSTGSLLKDSLLDTLIETASCIRISFPGINPTAYAVYSGQARKDCFTYDSAIKLLEKIVEKRSKLNRENELLVGTRTCIRALNSGSYSSFIKTIGELGIDAFQAVKVLTPDFEAHEDEFITQNVIEELLQLKETYHQYGIKSFQIPMFLDSVYNNRSLDKSLKPSKCWSSLVSPILYGTNLITCAHWDKITNSKYHYGIMEGQNNELETLMFGEKSKYIMANCPKKCSDCCSYNDNAFMDTLWKALKGYDTPENIQFYFEY